MDDTFEADWLAQAEALATAASPDFLQDIRNRARECFAATGFPDHRTESWRFTNVSKLAETRFSPADPTQSLAAVPSPWWWDSLQTPYVRTIGNGLVQAFLPGATLPEGVAMYSLHHGDPLPAELAVAIGSIADITHSPFTALNTAMFRDALILHIKAGTMVEAPLHIHHVGYTNGLTSHIQPRIYVCVDEGASVCLVESFTSAASSPFFLNSVMEMQIGAGARVDLVRLQDDDRHAYHVAGLYVRQQSESTFASYAINIGSGLSRHDILVDLIGNKSESTLNGLYLGESEQLHDTHTTIHHRVADCRSHELYKGILNHQARGVFGGLIHVHPQAQKTDAMQTNRALLLSDDARVNTKPQLLIYADDVKCSHGATVGQLDEDALFYLETRGIDRQRARGILTVAFAAEAIEQLPIPELRQAIDTMLLERFSGDPT